MCNALCVCYDPSVRPLRKALSCLSNFRAVDYVPYGLSSTQGTKSIPVAGIGSPSDCSDPNVFVFKVAIIDSGLDAVAHRDCPCSNAGGASAKCVGKSCVSSSNSPDADYPRYNPIVWNFHGTHVFVTIGAIEGKATGASRA
jgi:hypothetical protein